VNQPVVGDLAQVGAEIADLRRNVLAEVKKVAVGMEDSVDQLLASVLARGHVMFEGVPGVAKTLLAKSVAEALGCRFHRIQFTPDLLPGDITGSSIYDRNKGEFVFKKGPIFTEILLGDEINRAPAKTQSALLEAMQERQVSVDGTTHDLGNPFLVIATQNPIEQEGVYRLPEAQLDRFFMRILFHHPTPDEEMEILRLHGRDTEKVAPVTGPGDIRRWQSRLQDVQASTVICRYVTDLAQESRRHRDVFLGMSPRASLSLLLASRGWALLQGRAYVTHDDVKRIAGPVLNHRLILRPEAEIAGRDASSVVEDILSRLRTVE
jgi:MoxR-like ATPase